MAGQVAAIDTVGRTIYLYGFGREKGLILTIICFIRQVSIKKGLPC